MQERKSMPTIKFITDDATKDLSTEIFRQLGITMSEAINIFLRQSILHGGLPFDVRIPKYNKVTLAAFEDMQQSKGKGLSGMYIESALAKLKEDEGDYE